MLPIKRTRRLRATSLLAALLSLSAGAFADIIVLNSGDRIDGKIVAEDAATLTVEYQLTKKIKDKKVINKSDIKELTRFTPAQEEMEEKGIKKLVPTPDLLKASDYESIIQDQLRTFVAKHPGTPEAKEVEGMITALNEEKIKVLSGQVKMEGAWLDEATAKREAYNIEAYRLRLAMKAKAAEVSETSYVEALREFEVLSTNYPASPQYLKAIPEALEILEKYDKQLIAMAAEQPVIAGVRENSLKGLQGTELDRTREAIEAEERTFKATLDAQVKNKEKWRATHKYNLKSIQDAQLVVAKERTALKGINLYALQVEIESLNAAIRAMADENPDEAEVSMGKLRPDKARLVNKKAFDTLDKDLTKLKQKKAAEMKASKSSMAGSAGAADGQAGGEGGNTLADAVKKKEEAKKKAAAEKEAKAKKLAEDKAAALARAAAEPPPPPTLMEKIQDNMLYIIGGLVGVLIIAMLLGKRKKVDDD